MTGLAEDHDAFIRLVDTAVKRLRIINPRHKLVRYFDCLEAEKPGAWKLFVNRFRKDSNLVIGVWMNYLRELEEALGERKPRQVHNPVRPSKRRQPLAVTGNVLSDPEEDIPF